MRVLAVFFRLYHCHYCQQNVYQMIGPYLPHSSTCFGTSVLHSIIPSPLFQIPPQVQITEVLGYAPTDNQLFPEPGKLMCGKCKKYFKRENIAQHTFCCDAADVNPSVMTKPDSRIYEQVVPVKAFRIEFLIRFLCFSLLFYPLLQFGAIFFS